MNGLNHNALTCSAVPIPPWERSLQTVEAQPYFSVSQASLVLEGIVFDRNNNLLFVDVATGRVFKLTPERQLSIVLKENSFGASGLAVHKDGRIFIASVGDMQRGSVRAIFESSDRCGKTVARTYLFGQRRTSQFSYYNMSAHNVYYVKFNSSFI